MPHEGEAGVEGVVALGVFVDLGGHGADDGEIVGGGSAFKSTAQRFKGEGGDRNDVVGPGSYSQEESAISRKSAAASGKVSSAFASTTLRDGFLGA